MKFIVVAKSFSTIKLNIFNYAVKPKQNEEIWGDADLNCCYGCLVSYNLKKSYFS